MGGLFLFSPRTSPEAIILSKAIGTSQHPDIFGVKFYPFGGGVVETQFRYAEVIFPNSQQFSHSAVYGSGWFYFPAFYVFVDAELVEIYFGSQQFELSIAEQNECFQTCPEWILELFYSYFFEWIFCVFLDPFVHLIFVEAAAVGLPISSAYFAVDWEGGVVPV